MARYLEGPDGLRIEPVELRPDNQHWLFARVKEPDAQVGEVWYIVTIHHRPVGMPGYFQLHELEDLLRDLGYSLRDLREPEESEGTGIA